ncbi:MAG: ABC transporter permease, partial [Marinilabiliaceae bacterium]
MKLALRIALRYLFAKKSQNVINVVSMISVTGVLVGSLALIVVLSVFNGLHGLIGSLYSSFDPELKIIPREGKVFSTDTIAFDDIRQTEGVEQITGILEDHALLRSEKRQVPAIVMGVDEHFADVSGIDSIIVEGEYNLEKKSKNSGVIGYVLADQLNMRLNFVRPLVIYAPKRTGNVSMMRPDQSFRKEYIHPAGTFGVHQHDYDSRYLVIHIDQARQLFEYSDDVVSSLGLSLKEGSKTKKVKTVLSQFLGDDFEVLDRQEQHATF